MHVIIQLSKHTEYTISRMNLMIYYKLWVKIICQCRFNNCNNCVILVGNVDNGGSMHRSVFNLIPKKGNAK